MHQGLAALFGGLREAVVLAVFADCGSQAAPACASAEPASSKPAAKMAL